MYSTENSYFSIAKAFQPRECCCRPPWSTATDSVDPLTYIGTMKANFATIIITALVGSASADFCGCFVAVDDTFSLDQAATAACCESVMKKELKHDDFCKIDQYFTVPHLFLQESSHSSGIPVESTGILVECCRNAGITLE